MKKEITARYSCKRKKDFITIFAIAVFSLIVTFELYLIFWLPMQLSRENAMQKHVSRQQLTELADALRGRCGTKDKTSLQKGEVELIRSTLDILAIYMRENQEKLSGSQIMEVKKILQRILAVTENWQQKQYVIKRETFDSAPVLKLLESKLDALDKLSPIK